MSSKDDIFDYVMNTPENTNPSVLRSLLSNLPSGGGSVLVVNAAIDFEHAESETEYPLILDKTMDEMLAAEYTVLSIGTGEGGDVYELVEAYRAQSEEEGVEMALMSWSAELQGMKFAAVASTEGGPMQAVLTASESGYTPPDETDEFTVFNTQYSGFYTASTTHAVTNPENAKQAIFTFNFQYGTADERLSGTAEARLVSRTPSGDGTTLVYEAIVEKSGVLWCITVASFDDGEGTRTNTVIVTNSPIDIFVLHGVLTSETTGTITETATDLLAAAQAKKRIMLQFTMDNDTINLEMGQRYFYTVDYSGRVDLNGMLYHTVDNNPCLVKVRVNTDEQNYPALVMSAGYFALTPLT